MNINNQNGFTIVQAIFILVVLALLGTYMVRLSTIGQATSTQALLQARAYQAARAGLEWGISRVVNDDITDDDFPVNDTGCDVSVIIEPDINNPYTEGSDEVNIYFIKSIAESAADLSSPDYVSRTLEVTIHD